jgi:hypothetical protein
VKLIDPEGHEVWLSIQCAAAATGVSVDTLLAAKRAREDAALVAERNAREAAWQAFLDKAAGPGDRYDQIRALGGMAKARQAYKLHAS